jgi:hypothetical protein
MGVSDEAPVKQGTDFFGRPLFGLMNHPVNPELLQRMSARTNGEFYGVNDRQGLERSFHRILDELEKTEIEDGGRVYGELFPAFVWPAMVLLFFELLLGLFVLRRWP